MAFMLKFIPYFLVGMLELGFLNHLLSFADNEDERSIKFGISRIEQILGREESKAFILRSKLGYKRKQRALGYLTCEGTFK